MNRIKNFRASFRYRLSVVFTIFTGIITAAFVALFIHTEISHYEERSAEKSKLLASLLASSITLPLYSENIPELEKHATDVISISPHIARIIIRSDNKMLVDIKTSTLYNEGKLVTATAKVAPTPTSPSLETVFGGTPQPPRPPLGSVTVSLETSDADIAIHDAIIKIAISALLFWIAVVVASYPILKRVTKSFQTLTSGLDSMMGGNFSARIPVDKDDEAGRAAQAVNRLAMALDEREIENRSLQDELIRSIQLEVQKQRQDIMAKLIQTNRMTSLGLLVASIAHNINTPNGAIKLAAQHVAEFWKDAEPILQQATAEEGDFSLARTPFSAAKYEIKNSIESILNNSVRVEQAVKDLRTYVVGDRNTYTSNLSVNRIVSESLSIVRAYGKKDEASIVPTLPPHIPPISGNSSQLVQVVVNILLNATQSMSDNSTGVVQVKTSYSIDTDEVSITVRDQGQGIAPEDMKHLFEAFYSTKLARGGSGLGLYISNFIVNEHNGRLIIDSELGKGTVATIYLPAEWKEKNA